MIRGTYKKGQKLHGNIAPDVLRRMKNYKIPVYIVGGDIEAEKAYSVSTKGAPARLNEISTKHPIDCSTIQQLWHEVNEYLEHPIGYEKRSYFR